jgi:4a-hydroxytetrahydrobiopterin dehydratase
MTHLVDKVCEVVREDESPIQGDDLTHYRAQIHDEWRVRDEERLHRRFMFPSYERAVEFTNRIAGIATSEGHHPEIRLSYGEVEVELTTEELEGLHQNDFIMAAKIDQEHREFRSN